MDTPEAETEYADRLKEQADYFGMATPAEAVKLGEEAAAFGKATLAGGFTVYTRWNMALGRSQEQRYYALVSLGKVDYGELLVSKGLARIYGTRTPLPDGRDSREYAHLATVETGAKAARLGGWKRGPSAVSTSPAAPPKPSSSTSPSGTDFNQTFKKPR